MSDRFAARTGVSMADSIAEIERTARKYGGEQFVFGVADDRAVVGFTKDGRQVRFQVPFGEKDTGYAQRQRQRMRALLLVIKARLEAVASGVETFEDSFLANIVLPDGRLVGQEVKERIAIAYATGQMPALLPDYSDKDPAHG
jgi:hypothetical protein